MASFLSNLFGSGGAGDFNKFVNKYTGQIEQNYGNLNTGLAQNSLDELGRLTGQAAGAIGTGTGQSLAALGQARGDARNDIFNYGLAGLGQLNQGRDDARDAATSYGNAAADSYLPYIQSGNRANELYTDSLGLNGGAGNDRATSAFRAGPGYQYRVDQATDAAARKASSLGISGSGNTLSALAELGGNLADQEFGGWQDRLSGLSGQGLQATGARAGTLSSLGQYLGNLHSGYGANAAGILGGIGSGLAGADTTYGNAASQNYIGQGNSLANLYAGQGSQQAGIRTGLGNSLTNLASDLARLNFQSGQASGQAQQQGAGNLFGAVTGGIKAIGGLL